MKIPDSFPHQISRSGISVLIRRVPKGEGVYYVVDHVLQGKRKQVWRATFADAKAKAEEAIEKIANGEQAVLQLKDSDRYTYLRAIEALAANKTPLDVAAREYAEAIALLKGRTSIQDACRFWLKHHAVDLPKITVAAAVQELEERDRANVNDARMHQLGVLLGRFAADFNQDVAQVEPATVDDWLAKLTKKKGGAMSEKSKRNHRDVVGYFNRFCVAKGYLAKGSDWLEHARNYSAAKRGKIEIYTPGEFKKILAAADERLVGFLAINGFAGVRHEEIARLDWKDVALGANGHAFISIHADNAKTRVGRMVPVKENLRKWLQSRRQEAGPVCEFANINKQLARAARNAGLTWKKNALRHSYISYRKAETADIARVADEAGNSVEVIKANYLQVIKPTVAAEWFGILPTVRKKQKARKASRPKNIIQLPAAA
jgi:integrase